MMYSLYGLSLLLLRMLGSTSSNATRAIRALSWTRIRRLGMACTPSKSGGLGFLPEGLAFWDQHTAHRGMTMDSSAMRPYACCHNYILTACQLPSGLKKKHTAGLRPQKSKKRPRTSPSCTRRLCKPPAWLCPGPSSN